MPKEPKPKLSSLEDLMNQPNSLKESKKALAREAYQFAMGEQRADGGVKFGAEGRFEQWLEKKLK
jgi:hypothetical protein